MTGHRNCRSIRIPKLQLLRIGLPPQISLLILYVELRFRGPYVRGSRFEEPHVTASLHADYKSSPRAMTTLAHISLTTAVVPFVTSL
jgi:hypothetical protein